LYLQSLVYLFPLFIADILSHIYLL